MWRKIGKVLDWILGTLLISAILIALFLSVKQGEKIIELLEEQNELSRIEYPLDLSEYK